MSFDIICSAQQIIIPANTNGHMSQFRRRLIAVRPRFSPSSAGPARDPLQFKDGMKGAWGGFSLATTSPAASPQLVSPAAATIHRGSFLPFFLLLNY